MLTRYPPYNIRFGFVVEKFSMKVRVSVLVSRICWNLVLEGSQCRRLQLLV